MKIYGYWEGKPHWFYELCWSTVKKHNPYATKLGPDDTKDIVGSLPEIVQEVYVVHRVDLLRKLVIYNLGGLYVDHDFICWSNLDWLAQTQLDFVGYQEWHGPLMDNFFSARQNSPIVKLAADYALAQIQIAGQDCTWLSTNGDAISHALGRHAWGKWCLLPTHLIGPVSVMDVSWFQAVDPDPNFAYGYNSLGFITSFHGQGGWLNANFKNADQFLASSTRIAQLMKRGLGL